MSKQDRQGARTPAQLEYRYNFGKTFAEVYGLIGDAQATADEAKEAIDNLDHEQVFNLLTDNGKQQGFFRENGNVYMNASYIRSGQLSAEFINADELEINNGAFIGGTINVGNGNFDVDIDGNVGIKGSINFQNGYVGLASGKYNGQTTKGVAMADADTLQNGEIDYESVGRYVIVTDSGVRMQAGYNNVTLTNNGIYLAIKTANDAVIHRLCVEPDGLWWEVGETRYKIAGDSGLEITQGVDTNG